MDDHSPLIERAFSLPVDEHADVPTALTGTLPSWLRGTCYLNGPGRFSRGGLQYRHWLDGDGMVCALRFAAAGPTLSNRFVRSEKFVREEAAGHPIFRTFGTAFAGDELKRAIGVASPINVSIYPYAGSLLAFGEQGLPCAIDGRTLDTRGVFTFDGQLNEVTPFGAHPKLDYRTGEMINFGVSFSPEHPTLNLFRFAADGRLIYRRRLPLPYPASIHDFAITERYVAFYISPLVLRMERLLDGGTVMDALAWQPELGTTIMIASRATGDLVTTIDAGDRYCLHLVNAFERREQVVIDLIEYDKPLYPEYQVIPHLFTDTFRGRPVRLVVDVRGASILERRPVAYECSPDFPAHDPALTGVPYDCFWALGIGHAGRPGRKFFDQLVRVEWPTESVDVYQALDGHYLGGEPLFIPDPAAQRRGIVVCQLFDAGRTASSFAMFDAFDLASGPFATIALPEPIPLLFHSVFIPA